MFSTFVLYALASSGVAFAAPALQQRQAATWPEPEQGAIPSTNNDLARWWASQINWSAVPGIPATAVNATCDPAVNPLQVEQSGANCWWTCTQCTRPQDLTICPTPGDWGLTFDDGPTPETAELLDNLAIDGTKATFFIIGAQAWKYPDMVRRIAAEGHQIAVHTWSHTALTSLSNEQIVVELAWTRELLSQIIANPDIPITLMRPPYGDIDDRVRAITGQMGLQPAMWTPGFDTNDWKLVNTPEVQGELEAQFGGFLAAGRSGRPGFITLQHDSGPATVRYAIDVVLPRARNEGWRLRSLAQCGAV